MTNIYDKSARTRDVAINSFSDSPAGDFLLADFSSSFRTRSAHTSVGVALDELVFRSPGAFHSISDLALCGRSDAGLGIFQNDNRKESICSITVSAADTRNKQLVGKLSRPRRDLMFEDS